jgi:hypothetical protein
MEAVLLGLPEGMPLAVGKSFWFQHSTAPVHSGEDVQQWLNLTHPGRWIGRWWLRILHGFLSRQICDGFFPVRHLKEPMYTIPPRTVKRLFERMLSTFKWMKTTTNAHCNYWAVPFGSDAYSENWTSQKACYTIVVVCFLMRNRTVESLRMNFVSLCIGIQSSRTMGDCCPVRASSESGQGKVVEYLLSGPWSSQ